MGRQDTQKEGQIPHNLPARIQPFVNREKASQEVIQALLYPDIPIVMVTGVGGIGKTALALEVAHRLLEQGQFPGGICWLNCWGKDNTLEAILRTIQVTFGLAPVPTLHEGVRRYLRTNPCLLVLDGYEAVAQDMEILAFLERLPESSKALLTSREIIRLRRSWVLALDGLPTEDAIRLFMIAAERTAISRSFHNTTDGSLGLCSIVPKRLGYGGVALQPLYGLPCRATLIWPCSGTLWP